MFAAAAKTAESPDPSPSISVKLDASWKKIIGPIEPFLEDVGARLNAQVDAFEPEIAGFARYALSNHGKQLRPALVALAGKAAGELGDRHAKAAMIAACEPCG